MPANILVVSFREEDIKFAKRLAKDNQLTVQHCVTKEELRNSLTQSSHSIVLLEADLEHVYMEMGKILSKYMGPTRIFVLTDKPYEHYPHLFRVPYFGHHFIRRFGDEAVHMGSMILRAALSKQTEGIAQYFPPQTKVARVQLNRSFDKAVAVQAIQNHLTRAGIKGRLAALVSQSTDELILNALFRAPNHPRPKHSDFQLNDKGKIEVEHAATQDYMGISVVDHYGSLRRKTILETLRKHYELSSSGTRRVDEHTRLGIYGISKAGFSLLFTCRPRAATEVMLFFPRTENHRQFLASFRFFSLFMT